MRPYPRPVTSLVKIAYGGHDTDWLGNRGSGAGLDYQLMPRVDRDVEGQHGVDAIVGGTQRREQPARHEHGRSGQLGRRR
jgi:hypothetical protein